MATYKHYDTLKYKTPTGNQLNCKGWIQEAALRMLLNNLDPEVAERPDDLIVYGGRGKAARNFESLDLIIKALKKHRGKRKDASLDLGISERTLYSKLKEYDIEK